MWGAAFAVKSFADHDCVFAASTRWLVSVKDASRTEVYHYEQMMQSPNVVKVDQIIYLDGGPTWDTSCTMTNLTSHVTLCVPAGPGVYDVDFNAYGFDYPETVTVVP